MTPFSATSLRKCGVALFLSVANITSQCKQAALPALLSAQCLHLTALAPILSGSADSDVTPVLDGWIKQICGAAPCQSADLQPLGDQLQPVCGDQHSPIVDTLFSIKDHYGDFYDAICAKKDDGQSCIIEVLQNFAQKTGKTASISFAGSLLNDMNGFMSTAATALADGSMCTPCLGTVFYEGKKFIPLIQNDNTLGTALAGLCEKPDNKPYGGQVGVGVTVPSGEKPKNTGGGSTESASASAPPTSDSASASASASGAPAPCGSASGAPAPSGGSASASGAPAPTGSASGAPKPSGSAAPVPSGKPSNAGPGPASAAHTGPVAPLSKSSDAAPSSSAKAAAGAGADHAKSSAGKVTLKGAVAAAALVGSFVAFL